MGTKKWPQWCEVWEGPVPANPAGLGAVLLSHSHPPCQLLQAGGCHRHSREWVVLYRNWLLLDGSVDTGGKAQLSVVDGPGTGTLETKRLKRQQSFCACLKQEHLFWLEGIKYFSIPKWDRIFLDSLLDSQKETDKLLQQNMVFHQVDEHCHHQWRFNSRCCFLTQAIILTDLWRTQHLNFVFWGAYQPIR